MMRMSVDLPQPLGPSRQTNSPSAMRKLRSEKMISPPKPMARVSSSMCGGGATSRRKSSPAAPTFALLDGHPLSSGRDVGCRAAIVLAEGRQRQQRKRGSAQAAWPGCNDTVKTRPALRLLDNGALPGFPCRQGCGDVAAGVQVNGQAEATHHGAAAALA